MQKRHIILGIALCALIILNALYNRQLFVELYMRFRLRDQHIVLALTTTPYRINKTALTLATLVSQNIRLDTIYLSIPHKFARDGSDYVIPEWLSNDKRFTILRTEDYGPGTKLLGLLEQVKLPPKTIIVTVDDDVFYPKNLALQLAYQSMLNPNYAIGISGVDPEYDQDNAIATTSPMGLIKRYERDGMVTILQGYGGIAYRAEFFDPSIFELLKNSPECRYVDDIYFASYLARRGIKRRMLKNQFIDVYEIQWFHRLGTGDDALHKQIPKPAFKHRACVERLQQNDARPVF